jgi:hypothetical protein
VGHSSKLPDEQGRAGDALRAAYGIGEDDRGTGTVVDNGQDVGSGELYDDLPLRSSRWNPRTATPLRKRAS